MTEVKTLARKAKAVTDIRSLARTHTETAINVLAKIASSPKAPAAARVTAASVLLDRGWGKPKQPIGGEGDNQAIEHIHRIIVGS